VRLLKCKDTGLSNPPHVGLKAHFAALKTEQCTMVSSAAPLQLTLHRVIQQAVHAAYLLPHAVREAALLVLSPVPLQLPLHKSSPSCTCCAPAATYGWPGCFPDAFCRQCSCRYTKQISCMYAMHLLPLAVNGAASLVPSAVPLQLPLQKGV
jgi:hypothetical protein